MGDRARERLAVDPFDASAWEDLLSAAERKRGPEGKAELRSVYEDFLKTFPTAAGYWREYAELEIRGGGDPAAVRAVFSRCLLTCLSVDLWRTYLNFIEKLNKAQGPEGLPEIRQAYEYTLDRLGQDVHAGNIWADYIAFLQNPRPGTPEYDALYGAAAPGAQSEGARTAAVRRAYQRALVVPTPQLDSIWQGYETFESTGSNKTLGKRELDEWRPRYQAARALLREREEKQAGISLKALALPPGRGGAAQAAQLSAWLEYLAWEQTNPQRLDELTYVARVSLAFDQAVMSLFHYPEVWLEYAHWHYEQGGGASAALAVLGRARRAVASCLALHLTAADLQEGSGQVGKAKEIYEELVSGLRPDGDAAAPAAAAAAPPAAPATQAPAPAQSSPAAAAAAAGPSPGGARTAGEQAAAAADAADAADAAPEAMVTEGAAAEEQPASPKGAAAAAEEQPASAEGAAAAADEQQGPTADGQEQDGQQADGAAAPAPAAPAPASSPAVPAAGQRASPAPASPATAAAPAAAAGVTAGLQLGAEQGTLAWIHYMRFSRRTESLMAARKLFLRARKWPGLGWQAFAASAALEWAQERKEQIPRNIFELGLKSFLGEPAYVLAYAQFLQGLGDTPNTRALFERALTSIPPEAAQPLWDAYLRFEYEVGSLAAAAAVEARRREALRNLPTSQQPQHEGTRLVQIKYSQLGLFPATEAQRVHLLRLLGEGTGAAAPPSVAVTPEVERRKASRDDERGDTERERERERGGRERSMSPGGRRGRERRGRDRSPSPRRMAPRSPPREPEMFRLPREMVILINQLPPAHALEGPVPDPERVLDVIARADFTPDGIAAHEQAAARERRRQRRAAEQGQMGGGPPGPGGAPFGRGGPMQQQQQQQQPGAYGAPGAGGMAGQKRRFEDDDFDSGSEDEGYAPGAPYGPGPGSEPGGGPGAAGLDIYRMRRKQQRS